MTKENIIPVILAGGSGTRLWPLSRKQYPKQFLSLDANEDSLLQATIKRITSLTMDNDGVILICNEEHRFIVAEQVRAIDNYNARIVLEPMGKNTAPAIGLAAFLATTTHGSDNQNHSSYANLSLENDPVLFILPADHVIKDQEAFANSVNEAIEFAQQGKLVTFGITPTRPETGYGYIKKGSKLGNGYEVTSFVEKPNLATAKEYLSSEDYLWNSGMFMFKASSYLQALQQYAPDIFENVSNSVTGLTFDNDFIRVKPEDYESIRSESIDYAVMERADNVVVVEMNANWSDIGSWNAVWQNHDKDENQNVLIGDVINIGSQHSYVYSDNRVVGLLGVEDLIVVDTQDALLVAQKSHVQNVKKIVEQLDNNARKEHINHRVVQRPWGCYDSVDMGHRYQVKRITVNPGAKLSVQMHYHRAEHWVVVSGTALITNGDKSFVLSENQSTYIPAGVIHALENPGKIPLEIIEVQSGGYLGEDDIVRFEDRYGRN